MTIHHVDEGLDTGDIVRQRGFEDVDPRWSYPRVMRHLCADAAGLFWEAFDAVAGGQQSTPQSGTAARARRFPTLAEVSTYRRTLAARRSR